MLIVSRQNYFSYYAVSLSSIIDLSPGKSSQLSEINFRYFHDAADIQFLDSLKVMLIFTFFGENVYVDYVRGEIQMIPESVNKK